MLNRRRQALRLFAFLIMTSYTALETKAVGPVDEITEEIRNDQNENTFAFNESKQEQKLDLDIYDDEVYVCEELTDEDIEEEIKMGEMELLAQLVEAEAGNQDLMGMRLVVDVVLNRVDSDEFPDTIAEVIFEEDQFSVIKNGYFDEVAWSISDECYEAVALECEERSNYDVLYFSRGKGDFATYYFKHQDHWFGW